MKKAEHMITSMSREKLTQNQNEYTSLVKLPNPTDDNLDRIGLLEIIFTKLDQGKILISGVA